jgi:aspartate kinase
VITGFIGKDREGNITTLGRGGSDLTACVIAASINAEEMIAYKDVHGIMSCDPRFVDNTETVDRISFSEASELSYFGAGVLQPGALLPAVRKGIPVSIRNSLDPSHKGTIILDKVEYGENPVRAITSKRDITLVDIVSTGIAGQSGFLSKIFSVFEELDISVDVIATSEVSVSMTLDDTGDLETLQQKLSDLAEVNIKGAKAMITVIGDIKRANQVLSECFRKMWELDIEVQMISHGASKVNSTFIVEDNIVHKAVNAIHSIFFRGGDS